MITNQSNSISITKARSILGKLLKRIKKNNYISLTKDGIPKVAIVDAGHLTNLESKVGKTFIDPRLLKYTREFTKKEIKAWEKEDAV